MNNPFQLVGTYDGETYIERRADQLLRRSIESNQSYPYFCAPRQSGKSSLIAHTINHLPQDRYKCLLIDLSELMGDYSDCKKSDDLLYQVMKYIAVRCGFAVSDICCDFPEDTFSKWLAASSIRFVIFLDELDALMDANQILNKNFSADFLQRLRGLFNKRVDKEYSTALRRLQFVLAGSVHPLHLAPDRARSPFNIGDNIPLLDLTIEQVSFLAAFLQRADIFIQAEAIACIYREAGGILHLTKLILHEAWEKLILLPATERVLTAALVRQLIRRLCEEAANNIHFLDIYRRIKLSDRLVTYLAQHHSTRLDDQNALSELILSGISSRERAFRAPIYAKVFGKEGPLRLVSSTPLSQRTRRTLRVVGSLTVVAGISMAFPWKEQGPSIGVKAPDLATWIVDDLAIPHDALTPLPRALERPVQKRLLQPDYEDIESSRLRSRRSNKHQRVSAVVFLDRGNHAQVQAIQDCANEALRHAAMPASSIIHLERVGSLKIVSAPDWAFRSELQQCLDQTFVNRKIASPVAAKIRITAAD